MIRRHDVQDNVLVISFLYNILARIKEIDPSIEIGLLTYRYPLPIKEGKKLRALAILPRYNLVTPRSLQELRAHGFRVYAWTINDVTLASRIVGYGVDGIATDRPDLKTALARQQTLLKYHHM